MLFKQIQSDLVAAMKAGDNEKKEALRYLVSAIKKEGIDKGEREDISDDLAMSILKRQVKQLKDSIDQFTKGGRDDLVAAESASLKVVEAYMPAQMSEEEIKEVVLRMKTEIGVDDKSKMGMLMGRCMGELKGKADGGVVKKVVEEVLG